MNFIEKSLCFCLFFVVIVFSQKAFASPDTIHVRAHENVDMVWFESYDETVEFPIEDKSFHKVWMHVTLGCASGGCSDWDYTVNLHLLTDDGEEFELGRLITPYGGFMRVGSNGFNNNWTHRYLYDVTDFVKLFSDETTIRAFYSGWSAGFSISIDFYFIEGVPEREVLAIKNIVHGSHNYSDAATYNNVHTPPVSLMTPEDTREARLRYLPSGHAFDNNVFCAEFCPRRYFLKVDGQQVGTGMIWKDDCGLNPLYPQGGTWVYDRANWCPGEAVPLHIYELGDMLVAGEEHTFDLDLEVFSWSGTQTPVYTTAFQVVYYGERNIVRDVELVDIIAPSTHEDFTRFNPICAQPVIRIKNNGLETSNEVKIEYGFPDGFSCTYTWSGELEFGEYADIELPALRWSQMDSENPLFFAEIMEVNGQADEVAYNNYKSTDFELPVLFPDFFVLNMRTNSRSQDFKYGIYNEDGSAIFERIPNSSNALFSDTLELEPGCYFFEIWDEQGFGLNDWPTGQGNGSVEFRRILTGNIFTGLRSIPRDFGTRYRINFTIGYSLEDEPDRGGCGFPVSATSLEPIDYEIKIYPNPAKDHLHISIDQHTDLYAIRLFGLDGRMLDNQENLIGTEFLYRLPAKLQSGFYILEVKTSAGFHYEKVFIE
ncbi:MAG: T9SS C-terminal target domain-containing protein [Saprospirales bacterium]|nr:MAG: T9SS C-terminal target domain-containing protein [Saprospirales bacterium]